MAYLKREKMKKKEKSITFVAAEKGVFVHRWAMTIYAAPSEQLGTTVH